MEGKEKIHTIVLPKERTPATVVSCRLRPGDPVKKGDVIATFQYLQQPSDPAAPTRPTKEDYRSSWDGVLHTLPVKEGDILKAGDVFFEVLEHCSHGAQFGGLCAWCGKDMTISHYEDSETNRATIRMTHDALGVTVSLEEAQRLEGENMDRLLKSRRLSLILDLDQTIIQATANPIVGEWLSHPNNPKYPELKDVHAFRLHDSPGKTLYVKLRPGTREFLEKVSRLFELHIYTMGSRSYAQAVADIIDPKRDLFRERILSRDESGSFTAKSIQRLFPCDQSMVVIVDDRADIWGWSANLIKVIPYEFFVGAGDINAPPVAGSTNSDAEKTLTAASTTTTSAAQIAGGESIPQSAATDLSTSRASEFAPDAVESAGEPIPSETSEPGSDDRPPQSSKPFVFAVPSPKPKPVLADDDRELDLVYDRLKLVHERFYAAWDRGTKYKASRLLKGGLANTVADADVRFIMESLKSTVLRGIKILFSSIIPLQDDPEKHEMWNVAVSFGAKCSVELCPDITHVVAAKRGTLKVNSAKKMPGVKIVRPEWLTLSVAHWRRLDETQYLLEPVCPGQPKFQPSLILSPLKTTDLDPSSTDDLLPSPEDKAIVEGRWEYADDVYIKVGGEDWQDMDREVEEAMEDSDEDDDADDAGGDEDGKKDDHEGEDQDPGLAKSETRSIGPSASNQLAAVGQIDEPMEDVDGGLDSDGLDLDLDQMLDEEVSAALQDIGTPKGLGSSKRPESPKPVGRPPSTPVPSVSIADKSAGPPEAPQSHPTKPENGKSMEERLMDRIAALEAEEAAENATASDARGSGLKRRLMGSEPALDRESKLMRTNPKGDVSYRLQSRRPAPSSRNHINMDEAESRTNHDDHDDHSDTHGDTHGDNGDSSSSDSSDGSGSDDNDDNDDNDNASSSGSSQSSASDS
ncbi:uncharacterized protein BJ171DRAFT_498792 [Polychytrium aggregatum]|uniref:uncharacterized protein n=1 Tax=Polychytrium aggregatum TaxID=110093 RepID=UPI0022FE2628|nr:uncharacterized protein BJ171DRAFT_498792 [Polychytrium aggregatum]KAI9206134.1 hypothetical protein BJ171DRAFT_498792 [Polychytrium aggregatum]